MTSRDNFSEKTRTQLAARASWRCSFEGCGRVTAGPSEESPSASASIGEAAHISGASPGPGSRRYDPAMSSEERVGIQNGIWLCAAHARYLDRDEVTFPAARLRKMKAAHEDACKRELASPTAGEAASHIFAFGPEVVFTGKLEKLSNLSWTVRLDHFLLGDIGKVISVIDGFERIPLADCYILSDELGEGRQLAAAPTMGNDGSGRFLSCTLLPRFLRVDAQKLGSAMASHPNTGDIYLDFTGSIARVSGLDFMPQLFRSVLSMQRGENVFAKSSGVRFYEYFSTYRDTYWFPALMKLEIVRQASIPITILNGDPRLPLRCVERVLAVEFIRGPNSDSRIDLSVRFDVSGVGEWSGNLSVYLPTADQMKAQAERVDKISAQLQP